MTVQQAASDIHSIGGGEQEVRMQESSHQKDQGDAVVMEKLGTIPMVDVVQADLVKKAEVALVEEVQEAPMEELQAGSVEELQAPALEELQRTPRVKKYTKKSKKSKSNTVSPSDQRGPVVSPNPAAKVNV